MQARKCQTPGCNGSPAAKGNRATTCLWCIRNEFSERGLTLIGQYVNANVPCLAIHRQCGRSAFVSLSNVRRGSSGCRSCSIRAAKRRDEAVVIAAFDKVGIEFIGPYINGLTPCVGRCRTCGRTVSPMPTNVTRRGNGCRFCALNATQQARRIPTEVALSEMHAAGFQPTGKYRDANCRLTAIHTACGRRTTVSLTEIRLGLAGCRICAGEAQAERQRIDARNAVRELEVAGYRLLEPYVDANTRVLAIHNSCDTQTKTSLSEIRSSRGAPCRVCGRHRTAAARRLGLDEVKKRLDTLSLDYIGPYINGNQPIGVDCRLCHTRSAIRVQALYRRIGPGCTSCARIGIYTKRFLDNHPDIAERAAHLYLVEFRHLDGESFLKVGIGLVDRGRLKHHIRIGGKVLMTFEGTLRDCFEREQALLRANREFRYSPTTDKIMGGGRECFVLNAPIELGPGWPNQPGRLSAPIAAVLWSRGRV
jgi:hypothetical protein